MIGQIDTRTLSGKQCTSRNCRARVGGNDIIVLSAHHYPYVFCSRDCLMVWLEKNTRKNKRSIMELEKAS